MEPTILNKDNKWYVLRAISGKENKVKLLLDNEIEYSGWDKVISQVLIPTEKVYKIRKGKKNMFPIIVLCIQHRNLISNRFLRI